MGKIHLFGAGRLMGFTQHVLQGVTVWSAEQRRPALISARRAVRYSHNSELAQHLWNQCTQLATTAVTGLIGALLDYQKKNADWAGGEDTVSVVQF